MANTPSDMTEAARKLRMGVGSVVDNAPTELETAFMRLGFTRILPPSSDSTLFFVRDSEDFERNIASEFCYLRAATIYGGSNEIQKNIIAKNVLGLPRH